MSITLRNSSPGTMKQQVSNKKKRKTYSQTRNPISSNLFHDLQFYTLLLSAPINTREFISHNMHRIFTFPKLASCLYKTFEPDKLTVHCGNYLKYVAVHSVLVYETINIDRKKSIDN